MALINKQKGRVGDSSENSLVEITTGLANGEIGLHHNLKTLTVGTKNGNITFDSTEVSDAKVLEGEVITNRASYISSGTIDKQDDANIFETVVGNEYKMANTDRFVNFDGNVMDTYGPELVTNGDFSDGTTVGATQLDNESVLSNDSLTLKIENSDNTAGGAKFTSTLPIIGNTYLIKFSVVETSNNVNARYLFGGTDEYLNVGDYTRTILATSASELKLTNGSQGTLGQFCRFDNISVREITTINMVDMMPEVMVVGWTA